MTELCALPSVALADGEGDRISVGGVEITFKSPGDKDESWTVLDYKLPAHQFGAPLHYHHKLIETFYILSGEVWFRLGDKEVILGPGGFVLASPGTPHSFANRTGEPARMLAHASHSDHKKFLCELFRMIQSEAVWPPRDPRAIIELGRRYDTVYL
jgi:mannose-6-phosphate isomerase-like protein (cupin superfamily)